MSWGRMFQSRLPATGKARSPMVTSCVDRTVSRADNNECRHWRLVSATRRMWRETIWVQPATNCDARCQLVSTNNLGRGLQPLCKAGDEAVKRCVKLGVVKWSKRGTLLSEIVVVRRFWMSGSKQLWDIYWYFSGSCWWMWTDEYVWKYEDICSSLEARSHGSPCNRHGVPDLSLQYGDSLLSSVRNAVITFLLLKTSAAHKHDDYIVLFHGRTRTAYLYHCVWSGVTGH